MENERLTVNGISYEPGSNQRYEYFSHLDQFGVLWQVWRHLTGQDTDLWYASAHQLQSGGLDLILLKGPDHRKLLAGLAELIKLSNWLRQEQPTRKEGVPVVTVKALAGASVELEIKCRGCGRPERVTLQAADYLQLLKRAAPVEELFPDLTPTLRELLTSGVCPNCSQEVFDAKDGGAVNKGDS